MIQSNLPALQIILPLIAAPICAIIPCKKLSWYFTALISILVFAIACTLLTNITNDGNLTYEMGGWNAPYGIEYNVDPLSGFMLFIVSFIGLIGVFYAYESCKFEIEEHKIPQFFAVFLLCLGGLLGMIITNDAFNIYVFLEISSLATYTLIAMGKNRQALTSSLEYLILGTIGAAFILIAVGFLYIMTGTLNISDLANSIKDIHDTIPIKAALAFFTIGLALKIAMFPLHLWLTNAYASAPSFVSVFLSATATKVSIYVLIRILFSLFGIEFSFHNMPIGKILITLALFATIIGSVIAVYQNNVKKILAYSSVAQIGYILIGIGLAHKLGIIAALIHIFNHAITKAALFMAAGCVYFRTSSVDIKSFYGIGKTMPWTMGAFLIAGLSLVGIPLTAGFISKWYLLKAVSYEQQWALLALLLTSSIISVIYIWRIIEVAYFIEPLNKNKNITEAPLTLLLPLWAMVASIIFFGIFTSYPTTMVENIANYLFK